MKTMLKKSFYTALCTICLTHMSWCQNGIEAQKLSLRDWGLYTSFDMQVGDNKIESLQQLASSHLLMLGSRFNLLPELSIGLSTGFSEILYLTIPLEFNMRYATKGKYGFFTEGQLAWLIPTNTSSDDNEWLSIRNEAGSYFGVKLGIQKRLNTEDVFSVGLGYREFSLSRLTESMNWGSGMYTISEKYKLSRFFISLGYQF